MSAWKQPGTRRLWKRDTLTTKRRVWWCRDGGCWRWRTTRITGEVLGADTAATMWLAMEAADQIGVTLDPPGGIGYPEQR